MKHDIFCCQETSAVNEWFRMLPCTATVLLMKRRAEDIQPENYVSGLNDNTSVIRIGKYMSREGQITTIKPLDHLVYTMHLMLLLPFILLHRAVVFITPPYYNTAIIPVLRLFRRKVYLVVLDPQTRLQLTYENKKSPLVYLYMKAAFLAERLAVRSATKIFVVSKFLEKAYEGKNRNVFLVPNGADVDRINRVKAKRMFKNFTITYTGSFDKWRSVDLIVDAFKIARKKMPGAKLLLIGGGGDIENIRRMAAGDKDIVVTGWIRNNEDVIAYCKGSDLLLMTPRSSTLAKTVSSIKCFEYIASEVPLLVTDTGEHADWVRKLGVGAVVNADKESIADGMVKMMKDKRAYANAKRNCAKSKELVDYHKTRRTFVEKISKDIC